MIRINQLKLPLGYESGQLLEKTAKTLGVSQEEIRQVTIVKESIDARKKPEIFYSYIVDAALKEGGRRREEKLLKRKKDRNLSISEDKPYRLPDCGIKSLSSPPVLLEPDRPVCSAALCWQERATARFFWSGERMWMPGQSG